MPFSAGPAWNIFPLSPHYKKEIKKTLSVIRESFILFRICQNRPPPPPCPPLCPPNEPWDLCFDGLGIGVTIRFVYR